MVPFLLLVLCLGVVVHGHGESGGPARDNATLAGGSGASENCSGQLQDATTCGMQVYEDYEKSIKALFEENKPKLENCFNENNCKPPSTLSETNDSLARQRQECVGSVIMKGMKSIGHCIKEKLPTVTLPHISYNYTDQMSFHPTKICGVLNQSCGSGGNRTGVRRCLARVFVSDMKAIRNEFEKFCDKEHQCIQKLSKNCEEQFYQMKEVSDMCALKAFSGDVTDGIPACQGLPHDSDQEKCKAELGIGFKEQNRNGGQHTTESNWATPRPKSRDVCGSFDEHYKQNFGYGYDEKDGMPSHKGNSSRR